MANQQREESESSEQAGEQAGAAPSSRERPVRVQERSGTGLSRSSPAGLAGAFGAFPFGLEPFAFMRRMIEDMDRMFDDVLGRTWGSLTARAEDVPFLRWSPQIELVQQGDELIVRADLPGTREEDICVEVLDNAIVIAGERRSEREVERGNVVRSECTYGNFRRVVPLPEGTDTANASASYADGVLEIRASVPERPSTPRQLEIKGAARRAEGSEGRAH
jgi:HSP20 family protein